MNRQCATEILGTRCGAYATVIDPAVAVVVDTIAGLDSAVSRRADGRAANGIAPIAVAVDTIAAGFRGSGVNPQVVVVAVVADTTRRRVRTRGRTRRPDGHAAIAVAVIVVVAALVDCAVAVVVETITDLDGRRARSRTSLVDRTVAVIVDAVVADFNCGMFRNASNAVADAGGDTADATDVAGIADRSATARSGRREVAGLARTRYATRAGTGIVAHGVRRSHRTGRRTVGSVGDGAGYAGVVPDLGACAPGDDDESERENELNLGHDEALPFPRVRGAVSLCCKGLRKNRMLFHLKGPIIEIDPFEWKGEER